MTSTETTASLLQVKDLSLTLRSGKDDSLVLDAVSFSLEKNRTLGIVGESGSGKTMTALCLLNLVPAPPLKKISGEVLFKGRDLLTCSKAELRKIRGKQISYIFQEPMTALNPVLTIGEQITEMIRVHEPLSRKRAQARAAALLDEVGIPSPGQRLKNYPHELSGGMRQRAMIAMALSCDPEILIADEPTTALDVTIQAQVLELFKELIADRGMSIVFVTHDLSVMAEIADDILVMRRGKIVEQAPIEQIFQEPAHPYTRELLALLNP